MKRLEEEGYIRNYVALVDNKKVGLPLVVFCNVSLAVHNDEHIQRFKAEIQEIDEVMECYSIGGIYVDVPYTIDYQVYTQDQAPVHIEAGNQLLNGEQCVALARMRTAYGDDQEAIRQSNVRAMAMALMKNVLQAPPVEIPGLIQNLSQCVSTSIDLQTMISLATDFAQAGNPTIYTCTGPYKGDFMEEYGGLWLCYEDPEGWATLMKAVDAGENPEAAETTVNGK